MKSMILAAGFGTRLMPYTACTPKPLFTVAGRTILDWMISRLKDAGATAVIVNTHHLHTAVENHVAGRDYGIHVETCYEPEILGTGGALKNAADFWDDQPFVVVNGDVFTTVDIEAVYRFHRKHSSPVTLVLCDDQEFNSVTLRPDATIIDFSPGGELDTAWTFTGIHVIDPPVLELIPAGRFSSIIDIYQGLMRQGKAIQAYIPQNMLWDDLGTPGRYARVARRETAKRAFVLAYPDIFPEKVDRVELAGDGSDRRWFRLTCCERTLIMVDHGIRKAGRTNEVDAFVRIGRHLLQKGVPLPEIVFADTFSGIACLQDLGDLRLQQAVRSAETESRIEALYQKVLGKLVRLSVDGCQGFDPDWAWQTPYYDRELILEKECRYFVESFLNLYAGLDVLYSDLAAEFEWLADQTLACSLEGFIHRDFQARNIMLLDGAPYFIDFQGGRIGPIQYDLASLLIDPYTDLPQALQDKLFQYFVRALSRVKDFNQEQFSRGYACCALTRNLQILGAFGHLVGNRGKAWFEAYIPCALKTLARTLERCFPDDAFAGLKAAVSKIKLNSCGIPIQFREKDPGQPFTSGR